MSSAFPLLNSPHLIISEVFNMLEFHELVNLSLCSTKTKSIIKFNWKKPEKLKVVMISSCFKSSVGFDYGTISKDLLKVTEKTNKSDNLINLETVEIDGYKLPIHSDKCLATYWSDKKLGLKKATEYVCDLFKTHINILVIGSVGLWTIDWINNSQKKPLPNAYIHQNQTLNYEEYFKVLTECKVTDILTIHASAPESFSFPSNLLLPKADCLIVTQGQWMTIDNLLNMDCKAIDIERTKFSSSEMNKFIKSWLNFKCPQLEYLYIQAENLTNHIDVLTDLEYIRLDQKQIFKMRQGRTCPFYFSYDVKRSDGVTASISVNRDIIAMFVKNN